MAGPSPVRTVQWNLHHQLLRSDVLITGSSSAGECHCAIVPSRASVTGEAAKRPNSGIDEYWWGVPPMNIEDSRIIARFQGLLTESLAAKRLGQYCPELKDALYQTMFEATCAARSQKNSRVPKCDAEGRSAC